MPHPVATLRDSLLGVLFPSTCIACEASLDAEQAEFCSACRSELSLIQGDVCGRCGAPVPFAKEALNRCATCEKDVIRFDRAVSLGVYDGLLRRLVLSAKDVAGEGIASVIGRMLHQAVQDKLGSQPVDVVTCIPMHWRRRVIRQHNAPEVMAEQLATRLGRPFAPRLLSFAQSTRKQSELATTDRRRNLRGAIRVNRGHELGGATVVLVDDILTTGATCSEAARVLKGAGAGRVIAVVAARSL